MKKNKKINPEIEYSYDDEIDLFELFQKIWKWKWITIVLVIIICTATFFYVKSTPVTYTTGATIRIGKIANVLVEQFPEVQTYMRSEVFNKNDINLITFSLKNEINYDQRNVVINNVNDNLINNVIKISCTANSPDIAFSCLNKAINNLLNRHNIIYNQALKKLNDNIDSLKTKMIIKPIYFLDTYKYPSSLILKPEKPINPDSKKLSLKIATAFFSSLFLGIFLSFFIDYILSHRKKN
jgi:hypothetical protein